MTTKPSMRSVSGHPVPCNGCDVDETETTMTRDSVLTLMLCFHSCLAFSFVPVSTAFLPCRVLPFLPNPPRYRPLTLALLALSRFPPSLLCHLPWDSHCLSSRITSH